MEYPLHVVVLFEQINQRQHLGSLRFGQLTGRAADIFMLG